MPAKNLEDVKVDVTVTNIELFIFFYGPSALLESMKWNGNPEGGMKVTFWLSSNSSNKQELSLAVCMGRI